MIILPGIPLWRRSNPWSSRTKSNKSSHSETLPGTIEKKHNRKEANNTVNKQGIIHGMMHNQVWCMSGLMSHGMARCNNQYYTLSEAQYATSCILTKLHIQLFSSIPFMYSSILNVVKHGKRWSISKLHYLGNLNEAGNKITIPEKPHMQIKFGTVLPTKHNFISC